MAVRKNSPFVGDHTLTRLVLAATITLWLLLSTLSCFAPMECRLSCVTCNACITICAWLLRCCVCFVGGWSYIANANTSDGLMGAVATNLFTCIDELLWLIVYLPSLPPLISSFSIAPCMFELQISLSQLGALFASIIV